MGSNIYFSQAELDKWKLLNECSNGLSHRQKRIFDSLIDNLEGNVKFQEIDSLRPGTGKTYTLLRLIKYFITVQKRVLYFNPYKRGQDRFAAEFSSADNFQTIDVLTGKMLAQEKFDLVILEDISQEFKDALLNLDFSGAIEHTTRVVVDSIRSILTNNEDCALIIVRDDWQELKTISDDIKIQTSLPFTRNGKREHPAASTAALTPRAKSDNYQLFISYRRDGGEYLAGRLADRFRLLGYKTFFDIESMRSGQFNEQIYNAIDECEGVLVVLPPNALDRCVNEDDWVRKEIRHALKQHKTIIPIMMRGFEFPETLPNDINNIRYMEGVSASSEFFDAVIEKIKRLLTNQSR